MNTRQRWLAIALVATAIVAFWPQHEDEKAGIEVVEASKPRGTGASRPGPQATPAGPSGGAQTTRITAAAEGNLFPHQTWMPPPPPPPKVKPLPPPPPAPPPMPFGYVGRWIENGSETFFISQGNQVIKARRGDVLGGNWRLDEVTPQALVFTYLPMEMTQTLRISP